MKKKIRLSKKEILESLNSETLPEQQEKESTKSRGTSDLANKYKFIHDKVYKDLPNWKKQVIDNKEYNDRIYTEFVKEVIVQTEQSEIE